MQATVNNNTVLFFFPFIRLLKKQSKASDNVTINSLNGQTFSDATVKQLY